MDALTFIILALATWRVSHLLSLESGPKDIFLRIRRLAGAREKPLGNWTSDHLIGQVLLCPLCFSIWVATTLYIIYVTMPWAWPAIVVLAVSGTASALQLGVDRK